MYPIRHGRPRDFDLLMRRVFESFCEANPTHPQFAGLYPDTIRADPESMGQWLLAEVDGELAAGMQVVPRALVIASRVSIPASGLGNVFCCPAFRGRGLMTALLGEAIAEMGRQGIVLSMLGGDRLRYGRMGWEHAGAARRLALSSRMCRFRDVPAVRVTDVHHWEGDQNVLQRMHEVYSELPYRSPRTLEEMALVMQRPGQSVWAWDPAGKAFAYVSLKGNSVAEYAGAVDGLEKILRFVLRSRGVDVVIPPMDAETERERLLLSLAQSFSVQPVAMTRIIDLAGLLRAYSPIVDERLKGWEGVQSLRIAGGEGGVTYVCEQGECRLLDGVRGEPLVLSVPDMTRLLFGPFNPSGLPRSGEAFRRLAFPLPLYWHALAHV
ncbi:MAG: GNAT family N-acetyltransferase [Lentisphaerae bacterium]|jgi:predicted N-acetyltransferase YhbS|nr:GNAT family N-acetyltransferase [Lentisphaerota bacterium]MBT4822967.1 GNAT family N-acetyltransferase [Lentisphaerota bacterium]MBT5609439.1 GNAT family N-acetyltransferase [Lentisphaerota bacterium]MBT7061240.1 GNAT family N-acetyltransferase [Lentisphaerota bacterium]MBT7848699.1 GNAT family N-acetyltransferase [Lentisphaerota bacterium]